jgi:hypothetical protein
MTDSEIRSTPSTVEARAGSRLCLVGSPYRTTASRTR